jgi:DNA-binding NarL/FixJ family response regulator
MPTAPYDHSSEDAVSQNARPDVAVLIVDDQLPFRLAARTVIKRANGFELVGEAASGEEALTQVAALRPALVLMDINMPGINGVEATRQIVAAHPDVVVFLCSTYALADLPPDASTSGATAYVNKEELAPSVIIDLWKRRADGFSSVTS